MGKQAKSDVVLQFKITLNDSVPKVWRRILVPADYTFFALHGAIQDAMGWFGGHLHGFYIWERGSKDTITIELPNPAMDDMPYPGQRRDEREERIADYFGKKVKQCVYCYDFGDNWDHTILFERVLPRPPRIVYPQCVAGANACPPEDCGGVGGYEYLQEILKNPRHKEHADMLEWLAIDDPAEFDPYEFNLDEVDFENHQERLDAGNRGFGWQPKMP